MRYLPLFLLFIGLSTLAEDDLDLELDLPEERVEKEAKKKKKKKPEPAKPWRIESTEFTMELRQFADDDDDETFENQRAFKARIHAEKELGGGLLKAIVSARYDDQDPNRNLFWPEDLNYSKLLASKYNFQVGYKIFNFSNMDAFNPLDTINARIFDVSIVNAEKMGELALGVSAQKLGGYLSFYFLPNPTRPVLPGSNSRINLDTNLDTAIWMGSKDDEPNWDDHFLISWEGMFGDWDATIVITKGIDRTRAIVGTDDYNITLDNAIPNGTKFNTPYFFERYLTGVNLVGPIGDDLLKLSLSHSYYLSETEIFTAQQALEESSDPDDLVTPSDFSTLAIGYERPLEMSGNLSSSLIAEYQYQYYAGGENQAGFPLANDIFLAWRLNFNDLNSKQLTLSAMYDLEGNQEGFIQVDYSQRFMEVFKINAGILEYMIPDDASFSGYGIFKDTEHAYLNITYYL